MLTLKNISKIYKTGAFEQRALDNISISFRKNEFVSILGHSGGGKTTLLNIIGGLSKYTSGDLLINGESTKNFNDKQWDYYRNISVGFVFQSYNLISHQNVLKNVELALTLSGVDKEERLKRAKDALKEVGLEEHIYKKPNQLSGGQMQRVAIARALVNNPNIILADEPTGALDTKTSTQIMSLLKKIANDRLVIMVTHNPDLANEYSTRLVKLRDGKIISDSDPYNPNYEKKTFETKKVKLSLPTALSLSFNNLLTKKARTILTAFAGSIGIIGIALILALSNGVNDFIEETQRNALKAYPIQIQKEGLNLEDTFGAPPSTKSDHKDDKIYSNNFPLERESTLQSSIAKNNLSPLKKYLDKNEDKVNSYLGDNAITYLYDMNFDIYAKDKDGNTINTSGEEYEENKPGFMFQGLTTQPSNSYFKQLLTDKNGNISKLITEDYDLVKGKWPTKEDELVLFVDSNNKVDIKALYNFGLLPKKEYDSIREKLDDGQKIELEEKSLNPEDIIDHEFSVVSFSDYYEKDGDKFINIKENDDKRKKVIENGRKVKIKAIAKSKDEDADQLVQAPIGYTTKFTDMMINKALESEIVKEQKNNPEIDILNNIKFKSSNEKEKEENAKLFLKNLDENEKLEVSGYLLNVNPKLAEKMSENQNANLAANVNPLANQDKDTDSKTSSVSSPSLIDFFLKEPDKETLLKVYDEYLKDKNYNDNLEAFGLVSKDAPSEIDFYVENFENRQKVKDLINDFNKDVKEDEKVAFTDFVGLLTDSIRTIINAITYVLIAFVGVSLVVSSIMIGIITYISVLERTKEIGILRAIGASKKDILKVFMSETFIIGFLSGLIGIGVSVLLTFPISKLIQNLTDIPYISASLPFNAGIGLIIISVLLTLIAGIIPSRMASKKDPVEALSAE